MVTEPMELELGVVGDAVREELPLIATGVAKENKTKTCDFFIISTKTL